MQGAKPEDIVVESKLYRVTFSTQGAVVKSWVLKDYRDAKDKLLDTVNAPACESLGFPMSLGLTNPALKAQVNQGIYVATSRTWEACGLRAAVRGAFRDYALPSGHSDLHLQRRQGASEEAILLWPGVCGQGCG